MPARHVCWPPSGARQLLMTDWNAASIPDQTGRFAIVTGTGGLGYETALELASRGADVVLAGRNAEKGALVRSQDFGRGAGGESPFRGSRPREPGFNRRIREANCRLPRQAGPSRQQRRRHDAADATHHAGWFRAAVRHQPSRPLRAHRAIAASAARSRRGARHDCIQRHASYRPDQLRRSAIREALSPCRRLRPVQAREPHVRLRAATAERRKGLGLMSNAAHPGFALTDLIANGPGTKGLNYQLSRLLALILAHSPAEGALPTLFAATSPYAVPGRILRTEGHVRADRRTRPGARLRAIQGHGRRRSPVERIGETDRLDVSIAHLPRSSRLTCPCVTLGIARARSIVSHLSGGRHELRAHQVRTRRSNPHHHAQPSRQAQRLHRHHGPGDSKTRSCRADEDDAVRVIIVTGAGRGFCAGADISGGASAFDTKSGSTAMFAGTRPTRILGLKQRSGRPTKRAGFVEAIFNCRKPSIAAINGAAVGVGITLALPMDIKIASSEAKFGFVFARRGLVPEAGSAWFLPRLVGLNQALRWCLSGRVFGADEAKAGGLVSEVVAPDQLLAARARNRAGDGREHRAGLARADAPDAVGLFRDGPSVRADEDRWTAVGRTRRRSGREGRSLGVPGKAQARVSQERSPSNMPAGYKPAPR